VKEKVKSKKVKSMAMTVVLCICDDCANGAGDLIDFLKKGCCFAFLL
jgi:hypothetical protein